MHKTLVAFLSLMVSVSFAQSTIQIKTLEDGNGKPLPYSHVCIRDLVTDEVDYFVTNEEGLADFTFNGNTVISISYMGFKTLFDTIIEQADTIEYRLESESYEFNEIVITGQNKPISADKSIYSIEVIGKKEIEQTASNNLADLLSKQVNIQINHDPSLGSSLKLQGITGQNVKILVDNVPVIGRLNGNIDLSQLNLSEVEQIERIDGPMSVIYGSNALGGVINIITKKNKYARIIAGADLYYETVGVYNANGRFNWKKDKNAADFYFGRNFFDGYSINPNARRQDWKPKEQYSAGAQYRFSNKKTNLTAKLEGFNESLLDRNEVYPVYYGNATDTWYYTRRMNSDLHADLEFSDLSSFNGILSYRYYDRIKEKFTKDLQTLIANPSQNAEDMDTSVFNAFTARGVYNRNTFNEVWEYQMGFDINWEDAKGKRVLNNYEVMGDYALFLIVKWNISQRWMMQSGARMAYNTKYKAPIVPSINFKYSWGDNHNLRFSYARGFRAPSLKELYLFFIDSNHEIEGNPDLKAENSNSFNFSLNGRLSFIENPLTYKLSLFYNEIFDKIALVQVDTTNDIYYRNENISEYRTLGGVFEMNIRPAVFLNLDLAYSLTGRKDSSTELENYYFNSDVTANLNYGFWENTATLSINYKYVGEYPAYVLLEEGGIGISILDDYHNLDVNFSKSFYKKSLRIGMGVKNIFDNTQLDSTAGIGGGHGTSSAVSDLVGWGRTFFVSLKYQFTKYD